MTRCDTAWDDRIDPDLLALNQQATRALPEFVYGVRIEKDGWVPVHCEQIWLTYLAANIYGNADAALITMTLNHGREARGLVRNMFENLKKAEYFIAHPDEARLEYLAMPFRDERFRKQMKQPDNCERALSSQKAIAKITAAHPDVAAYAAKQNDSKPFYEMIKSAHANEADAAHEYAFHYRRLSQNTHATVAGMEDIFAYPDDTQIGVNFDGRIADPNFEIVLSSIYLLTFLTLLNDVFGLGREAEIEAMKVASGEIQNRLYGPAEAEVEPVVAEA
jgi:hypothetical protein